MTASELIEIGNRRIIEIVGARLGATNWDSWMQANGWEFAGGEYPRHFYKNPNWHEPYGAQWASADDVFLMELRRAMFRPETLLNDQSNAR